VNGDSYINIQDRTLLENFLNGTVNHLPGYWNLLISRAERESWLRMMVAIYKIDDDTGGGCIQSSNNFMISFHGFNSNDIANLLTEYSYGILNNGRFNIPVCRMDIRYYDLNGKDIGGHSMNTVIFGDDASIWSALCNIEPQFGVINVQPGQYYFLGTNSRADIKGPPTYLENGNAGCKHILCIKLKITLPLFILTRALS